MATKHLYNTREAGKELGISAAGVLELVHNGELRAVVQRVRRQSPGRKDRPRVFITGEELGRYVASRPEWKPGGVDPAPKPRASRTRAGVGAELATCKKYV